MSGATNGAPRKSHAARRTTPWQRSSVVLRLPFMMRSTICSTHGFSQPVRGARVEQAMLARDACTLRACFMSLPTVHTKRTRHTQHQQQQQQQQQQHHRLSTPPPPSTSAHTTQRHTPSVMSIFCTRSMDTGRR
jgi:hypothetical protein